MNQVKGLVPFPCHFHVNIPFGVDNNTMNRPGQNQKKKEARLAVRVRKIVFINYVFLVTGKINKFTNDLGYDVENLFVEACRDILRVSTMGRPLKKKRKNKDSESPEDLPSTNISVRPQAKRKFAAIPI